MPYSTPKRSVKELRYLNKDFTSFKDNLLGFTKIYLVGCDGGFISGGVDSFDEHLLYWWNECNKFIEIYYPNVEIISVNPVSLKGWFKDINN